MPNNTLARALIQELRANFKSYAVRDAGHSEPYILITSQLAMREVGFRLKVNGKFMEVTDEVADTATLEDFRKALWYAIQRRSAHARKRVQRISAELERGEQIVAAIEQQDNERLEKLLCALPSTPA